MPEGKQKPSKLHVESKKALMRITQKLLVWATRIDRITLTEFASRVRTTRRPFSAWSRGLGYPEERTVIALIEYVDRQSRKFLKEQSRSNPRYAFFKTNADELPEMRTLETGLKKARENLRFAIKREPLGHLKDRPRVFLIYCRIIEMLVERDAIYHRENGDLWL